MGTMPGAHNDESSKRSPGQMNVRMVEVEGSVVEKKLGGREGGRER
jgi:hypothetical protein